VPKPPKREDSRQTEGEEAPAGSKSATQGERQAREQGARRAIREREASGKARGGEFAALMRRGRRARMAMSKSSARPAGRQEKKKRGL